MNLINIHKVKRWHCPCA